LAERVVSRVVLSLIPVNPVIGGVQWIVRSSKREIAEKWLISRAFVEIFNQLAGIELR
jgi:hypothetical protein